MRQVRLLRGRSRLNGSRTGMCACQVVPLSHGKFGRAGPAAFALVNDIAEFAASSWVLFREFFWENGKRDLSTTLCRGIMTQVLATVPLRARLNGQPVVADHPNCPFTPYPIPLTLR